jgi:hypothetical protein
MVEKLRVSPLEGADENASNHILQWVSYPVFLAFSISFTKKCLGERYIFLLKTEKKVKNWVFFLQNFLINSVIEEY